MVNIIIYEGLKVALSKGESLRAAMTTFLNSGYPKAEIEEAARVLHAGGPVQRQPVAAPPQQPMPVQPTKTPQNVSAYGQPQQQPVPVTQPPQQIPQQGVQSKPLLPELAQPTKTPQNVSAYGQNAPTPQELAQPILDPRAIATRKTIIIVLATILFILLCTLAFLFIFKESVLTFFDKFKLF